jgi:hypothetical protein
MFFKEIGVTLVFVLGYLVIPELVKVNNRPEYWAWLLLAPLLLVKLPDSGACNLAARGRCQTPTRAADHHDNHPSP